MGGGSFRAPSMPRSNGGSFGGGYRGGGYRGGGMGFPFLIPIFGFGGGGLFGLLILMAVAGVLVNALRGIGNAPSIGGAAAAPAMPRNVKMIQVQVGLLASAKSLQDDLRSLASSSDTSSSEGLQRLLQEHARCEDRASFECAGRVAEQDQRSGGSVRGLMRAIIVRGCVL